MFNPASLPKDIWAGTTVALVALPLNLALAVAAGVPPGVGIATGITASVIASMLGGQKYAITGPAAAMAVILVQITARYGISGIWLVGLLAGIMQVTAGLLRLGRLISYIPMPVITGFANAIGILVAFNALDGFMGMPLKKHAPGAAPAVAHEIIPKFILDVQHLVQAILKGQANHDALIIGGLTLAVAVVVPRLTKAIPSQLVAIIVGTVASVVLGYQIPRIVDVAPLTDALPVLQMPVLPWDAFGLLFAAAFTVFMLGSIESLLSASVADGMTMSKKHHADQELIGQGFANVFMPFVGGIPVTGVIARTAINVRAGAQTRLSGIVHAVVLTVLIVFLSKYAEQIPLAALSAILILTGFRLFEWDEGREIWKASKLEAWVMILTTVVSVLVDLTAGVLAGLLFTCGLFIKQMSELRLVSAAETDGGENLSPALNMPCCKFAQTFLVDGPLFFGAAERFTENILQVQDVRVLVLDMSQVNHMDLTGVETLLSVHRQLERKGARMVLAALPTQPLELLRRTKAMNEIGEENIFRDLTQANIEAHVALLSSSCSDCAVGLDPSKKPAGPRDCKMRSALLADNSPLIQVVKDRLLKKDVVAPPVVADVQGRLVVVDDESKIPGFLRGSPIEVLLRAQNFRGTEIPYVARPELLIGMCVDYGKTVMLPKVWAHVIRREGASMQGSEFAIALSVADGVKYMALIAHDDCAMGNTVEHKDAFVKAMTGNHGWDPEQANGFFDIYVRSPDLNTEIDFIMEESARLQRLFRGILVIPLVYKTESDQLYLVSEWLSGRLETAG